MAVSPPFTINETEPASGDLISIFPTQEQPFRDTVESWLTFLSNPATGLLKPTAFPSPFELESTDAGAAAGPIISLYRNSASPAVSDLLGQITFAGEDSAGNKQDYVQIIGAIADPTSTTEDALLQFNLALAGTVTNVMTINGNGFTVNGLGTFTTPLSGTPVLQALSTNAGAASGPYFHLYRNSPSPAGNDVLGVVRFIGNNHLGGAAQYGAIYAVAEDVFSGLEDGALTLAVASNGGELARLTVSANSGTIVAGNLTVTGSQSILVNLVVTGTITSLSDDRFKTDWMEPGRGLIDSLAGLNAGTYFRTDLNERQVGVSAQSLQAVMPEAVMEDKDGNLSVAYGNAALVGVVALAREVQRLREELGL